jgi:hypothetical protein
MKRKSKKLIQSLIYIRFAFITILIVNFIFPMKKHITKYVIVIIIALTVASSANIQWGGNHWRDIVESDGKGYYAYLPALFIYHDLNFGFFEKTEKDYYNVNTYYDYRTNHNGRMIDKYYVGSAVAMLPFFFAADLVCHLSGLPADGYSKPYPVFINLAAIFYLFTGLIFLVRILRKHHASEFQVSLIMAAITFGTNLFYYTVCEPAMSHIYSFAFVNAFVYFLMNFCEEKKIKWLMLTCMALGMITLIRDRKSVV